MIRITLVLASISLIFGSMRAHAEPFKIAALGDSITTGFNTGGFFDQKELSWSTGRDQRVESHVKRLTQRFTVVQGRNFAVAGAKVNDVLTRQLANAVVYQPDYVTVMIGANDVCGQTPLTQFENDVEIILATLTTRLPNVKIQMVPIPDLGRLREVGLEDSQCQRKWNLLNMCRSLLHARATGQERQVVLERLEHANDILAAASARYPDHASIDMTLASYEFERRHISSVDCFHPSIAGQNLIAELSWSTGVFSDDR